MVQNLLNFNPSFRYKASELIMSSLFDDIRDPELEKRVSPIPVDLEVDRAGAFDY